MFRLSLLWQYLGLLSQCFVSVLPTPDVTNICGPATNQTLAQEIQTSRQLASDWLLAQRNSDWGWNLLNTESAILSLQLASEVWKEERDSLETQLTIKQLEIEMLRELSHKQSFRELPLGYLAYYVFALHATCHDVADFYGHNVLRHLHHRLESFNPNETSNYFPYALAVMAVCSSGNDVPRSVLATLEAAQMSDGCFPFGIDVTSMVVMALSCVKPTLNTAPELVSLRTLIRNCRRCILDHQRDDGGFSNSDRANVISTALAAQALLAEEAPPSKWQCEDAMRGIVDAQHEDGHFGSLAGTIQILPVLSNRHHGSLLDVDRECPEEVMESFPVIGTRNDTIAVTIVISQEGMPVVDYTPFTVDALPGENLFRVMERARQLGYFSFESKLTQFGNSISSINNVERDSANGFYWFIYQVHENGEEVSTPTGVDGIFPEDGNVYAFVYKEYVSHY